MEDLIFRQRGKDGFYKIWHKPEKNIFIFIHSGEGSFVLRENSYPMASGVLCFIGEGKNHYTFPDKPEKYQRSKLLMESRALEMIVKGMGLEASASNMFARDAFTMAILSPKDAEKAEEIFEEMSRIGDGDKLSSAKRCSAAARLMLLIAENATDETKSDPDPLQRAIDYINRHIPDELSIEAIASACYISKYYLCRLFKSRMGLTIMDYVLQTRIVMAKELLSEGKASVTHTCISCGFTNPSYFSRVFKEITGVSPIKYKKQMEKRDQSV